MRTGLWAALLATLLIAGCATPASDTATFNHESEQWSGRLALRVDSQPPQSFFAAFELSGDAANGRLTFISPLGSTLAVLRWQPADAVLLQGGSQRHYESVDNLLEQATGAAIPARALFAWLHGQPASVQGWQVDQSQWSQGRLLARRQTPPAAELRLILDR